MTTKHQVHNLIILDESGSMESIKPSIIQGFNEIVQTVKGIGEQFPEQEHFISLVTFNGIGKKLLHFMDPVERLEKIDEKRYQPAASTPLYDAMGYAITMLRDILQSKPVHNVLVTILTDGEENASQQYSRLMIKKLVEERREDGWTFTYIGANHEVEQFANNISINNTMRFDRDEEGVKEMFTKEKVARKFYSEKIRFNQSLDANFYDPENQSPA